MEHAALEQALATPVNKEPGAKIMRTMGWHEGEGLGPAGGGMTEPLCPDLAHERAAGLGDSSQAGSMPQQLVWRCFYFLPSALFTSE